MPAEGLMDRFQLGRVVQGEDPLPAPLGQTVEGQPEGLFQQGGQPLGKGFVLRDDAGLAGGKGVAVEQGAVGLRLGAAFTAQGGAAELGFHVSRKGHSHSSKMYRRSPRKMRTVRWR